jgi:hypothetical protein
MDGVSSPTRAPATAPLLPLFRVLTPTLSNPCAEGSGLFRQSMRRGGQRVARAYWLSRFASASKCLFNTCTVVRREPLEPTPGEPPVENYIERCCSESGWPVGLGVRQKATQDSTRRIIPEHPQRPGSACWDASTPGPERAGCRPTEGLPHRAEETCGRGRGHGQETVPQPGGWGRDPETVATWQSARDHVTSSL